MSKLRKAALAVAAAAVVVTPAATIAATTASAEAATSRATVKYIVDGDTIRLADGRYVRLIGYDAAETGSGCKATAQTKAVERLVRPGSTARLIHPASEPNTDRYGRLLRYVRVGATDVGTRLIRSWGAHAKYDSRDGYPHHPLEEKYRRLDANFGFVCGPGTAFPVGGTGDTRNSYPPVSTYECPAHAPIKGNASSMIYHLPSSATYDVTTPEECFETEAAAQAHGYRAARD